VTAIDLPPTRKVFFKQWEQNDDLYDEFHRSNCRRCHRPTNFRKWYTTREVYDVSFELKFEPYFVVRKSPTLPPFWEHFTGFGQNKVSWVEEVAAAGYRFYVSPDSFLIHINHDYKNQPTKHGGSLKDRIVCEYLEFFQPYVKRVHGTYLYDSLPESSD